MNAYGALVVFIGAVTFGVSVVLLSAFAIDQWITGFQWF